MSGIFISYRREDSAGWAAQLSRRLSDEFGKDQVFMDVITLKPSSDFVAEIQRWLARADSAIVLVGSHWLSLTDITGRRRLDDPKDQVRS